MIRVFPRRTKWTPTDELAFVGDPDMFIVGKKSTYKMPVRISVTFTWDWEEAKRLARSWHRFFEDVKVGGPDVKHRMHPNPVWRALSKKWCRPAGYKAFMKEQP